jgi:Xaa-Pro aminopeptidase
VGIPCIVDTGVEFNFYSSDITRTFLNYDFASNQKEKEKIKIAEEIKKGVENIQKTIISSVKEGISFKELNDMASQLITDFLIDFGILKVEASKDEILEKKIYKVFYPHSIGHHLGLDVHDVCQYYDEDGNPVKLPEKAVITIEPGIYIPNKEKVEVKEDGKVLYEIPIPEVMRGIGVRIEDDVLVMKNGFEIL